MFRQSVIIHSLSQINGTLLPRHKKRALFILILILFGGMLDIMGLAAVLPVANLVLNPQLIQTNQYVKLTYDTLGFNSNVSFLLFVLILLFAVFVLKNSCALFISWTQSRFSYSVGSDLSKRQFMHILDQDLEYMNHHNSNILVRHIHTIPYHFSTFMVLPMLTFLSDFFVVTMIVIAIAIYNFSILALVSLTLAPAFLIAYRLIKARASHYEKEKNLLSIESNKYAYQTIFGYVDVKLFNKDNFFVSGLMKTQKKLNRLNVLVFTLNLVPGKIIEVTAISGIIVLFGYSLLSASNAAAIGTILPIFLAAAYRIMPAMNRMLIALTSIKGYQYIFEILNQAGGTKTERKSEKDLSPLPFKKEILIKDLCFSYPEARKLALNKINLSIRPGDKIGIIGHSGSGKTTLMHVLLRFLKEQEGQITVDGILLDNSTEPQWRELIGYVKQNVFILDGDIYENVCFGIDREQVDEEKLNHVLKLSRLDEVIGKLPNGLNTNIGENGTRLSGGQRQRIAIARALYKDAAMLVFDEATSALDSQTEKEITESIETLSESGTTMIIVAHRITTLENCNIIYEMQEGEIIATHQYRDLIQNISAE
jgi:ABC-type bacteriocin/lantibiotic exporter with double-glycine peptidase domain